MPRLTDEEIQEARNLISNWGAGYAIPDRDGLLKRVLHLLAIALNELEERRKRDNADDDLTAAYLLGYERGKDRK
jgi:hypothetical protein